MPKTLPQKKQKSSKVSTTVRFDADLKRRAEAFARANHMDFTTLLHFSIQSTMQNGAKMDPEMSEERYQYYSNLADRSEKGLEKTYGPFEGKEAVRAYLDSIV